MVEGVAGWVLLCGSGFDSGKKGEHRVFGFALGAASRDCTLPAALGLLGQTDSAIGIIEHICSRVATVPAGFSQGVRLRVVARRRVDAVEDILQVLLSYAVHVCSSVV